MEEIKDMPTTEENTQVEKCPHCVRKEQEEAEREELNLAILIALMPALTITLFSSLGLF